MDNKDNNSIQNDIGKSLSVLEASPIPPPKMCYLWQLYVDDMLTADEVYQLIKDPTRDFSTFDTYHKYTDGTNLGCGESQKNVEVELLESDSVGFRINCIAITAIDEGHLELLYTFIDNGYYVKTCESYPNKHLYKRILDSCNLSDFQKSAVVQNLLRRGIELESYFAQIFFHKLVYTKAWNVWMDMGLKAKASTKCLNYIEIDEFLCMIDPTEQLLWIKKNTCFIPQCVFAFHTSEQRAKILQIITNVWTDKLDWTEAGITLENAISHCDWACARFMHEVLSMRIKSVLCVSKLLTGSFFTKDYNTETTTLERFQLHASMSIIREWVFNVYKNIIKEQWKKDCPEIINNSIYFPAFKDFNYAWISKKLNFV